MDKFVLALGAVVAFLLPIGIYCLFLASVNRRARPMLIGGALDSIGLLFALSGFLLITVPMLFSEFYRRMIENADADHVIAIWARHWLFSVTYYLLLASGGGLLMLTRSNKTMVYNVDLELLPKVLERTFALLGLESHRNGRRLVVTPLQAVAGDASSAFMETTPKPVVVPDDHRHAELVVETFAPMCHATLHWGVCTANVRQEIEAELNKNLENGAPLENSAAGWFMSASGLILGAATAIAVALAFVAIITRR